ncbi:golgin-45-like [Lytechinus pictus]|uniref:golgin-45-like n=1 Tax=Lytechinus pictus TaxID=7653 RepID=UPI0030B9E8C6
MASRVKQHLFTVQPQYIQRDDNRFTSSSPRPEAEGKEMDLGAETAEGTRLEGYRRPGAKPAFFDGKNRNSTDLAFRQRQNQKDVQFESSPRKENKSPVNVPSGEGLLQELYAEQREQLKKAESEKAETLKERDAFEMKCMELETELTAQIQVNKELKKLLVASMGADLHSQLETLARDRAQLAQEIENTMATLLKERETLERVNIQCDVWRSKFLGSRLQVDELITSRTHLDMLQQESFNAIQRLLDERAEIRRHMMKTNRLLQYLSSALQRNQSIDKDSCKTLSNVMTLALVNEQLSSTISNVLLGDVKGHHQGSGGLKGFEFVDWTEAELLAKDIVLNKQPSIKLEQISQQAILEGPVPKVNMTHRYHPHTRYENITINCCERCKGDIKVV